MVDSGRGQESRLMLVVVVDPGRVSWIVVMGRDRDRGLWFVDPGLWIMGRGSWVADRGSWIVDRGSGIRDRGSLIVDRRS